MLYCPKIHTLQPQVKSPMNTDKHDSASFTYEALDTLRHHHPAWRLLRADSAPLVASFLQRIFIAPNVREIAQADLLEALDDELYALRERLGADSYPGAAQDYLNKWSDNARGWLRKFYPPSSDEPHYDLTPATEKGVRWLKSMDFWAI